MADYYSVFDKIANDGYVLNQDWSSVIVPQRSLTTDEQKERRLWSQKLNKLRKHYCSPQAPVSPPRLETIDDLLDIRIPAPRLEEEKNNITSRTGTAEPRVRLYPKPKQLRKWDTFHDDGANGGVVNHSPQKAQFGSVYNDLFQKRLEFSERKSYNSDRSEEKYLLDFLRDTLFASRIVENIETEDETRGLQGKADFTLWVKEGKKKKLKLAVIGETKSSHNLLLPIDAKSIVRKYKQAYKRVIENGNAQRTTEWSHIAHPLAQLIGYMVDNKQRYGSLTSATRSYFVFLDGNGADMLVRVSDPYYIGEATYLRAWSHIVSLGAAQGGGFVSPTDWLKTTSDDPTPQPSPDSTGSESSQERTTSRATRKRPRDSSTDSKGPRPSQKKTSIRLMTGVSLDLPSVSFEDLTICAEIGFGRNGSVFRVQWKNQSFALKQFDMRKGGYDAFRRELAGYARVQSAWSRLVPRPMFVSESPSGGIRYLGLELGRDASGSDYHTTEWRSVLKSLETEYGVSSSILTAAMA